MTSQIMRAILLVWAVLLVSGCSAAEGHSQDQENLNPTYIQTVIVIEKSGNYNALVEGWLPDSCSTLAGTEQRVEGDTIYLNIYSSRPKDLDCAQVLIDFTEEFQLETEGLKPGTYKLIVNEDNAETSFTIS